MNAKELYEKAMEDLNNGDLEAVDTLRKAAELGDPFAQNNYGVLLYTGDIIDKDIEAALGWFRQAAEHGIDESQFHLGLEYYEGNVWSRITGRPSNGSGSLRRRDSRRHSTIWVFAITTVTACSGITVSRSGGSHWHRTGTTSPL